MRYLFTIALLACGAAFYGCNLVESIDDAKSREELIEEAKAALDEGDCEKAIAAINAINQVDDEVYKFRGWGELCSAGVTVNKVGKTLFNYDINQATNFNIIGDLADALVPVTGTNIERAMEATATFNLIHDTTLRATNLSFAYIAKAAIIIARASTDKTHVRRGDITLGTTCYGTASCAAPPAACGAGMSNQDANDLAQALDNAAAAAQQIPALGLLRTLASNLGTDTQHGAPSVTRCAIVNHMLRQ